MKLGTSQFVKVRECVASQRLQMLVDQQHGIVVESWSLDEVLELFGHHFMAHCVFNILDIGL
jgi:hypothetical protein